jgi:hypothetical protein
MVNQFWRRGKKKIVSSLYSKRFILTSLALIPIIGVVTVNGYSSRILVQMPNGPTIYWQLEPLRR